MSLVLSKSTFHPNDFGATGFGLKFMELKYGNGGTECHNLAIRTGVGKRDSICSAHVCRVRSRHSVVS